MWTENEDSGWTQKQGLDERTWIRKNVGQNLRSFSVNLLGESVYFENLSLTKYVHDTRRDVKNRFKRIRYQNNRKKRYIAEFEKSKIGNKTGGDSLVTIRVRGKAIYFSFNFFRKDFMIIIYEMGGGGSTAHVKIK